MMGFDTSLNLVSIYVTRKKNHGFWTKCGFEINKEIKGKEAEKLWVLTSSLDLVYVTRKKNLGFSTKCGFAFTKK